MSEAIAFILWLVFVGISAIIVGYFLKYYLGENSKEGFLSTRIYGCPTSSTNYVTKGGETNCCNGDVVDGVCTGNDVCTLSPNNKARLPTCDALAAQAAVDAGAAMCPSGPNGIPNYFASSDQSLIGCSVSSITADGTAPTDPSALQCILYPTPALDASKLDSCHNYLANQAALAEAKATCAAKEAPKAAAPKAAAPKAAAKRDSSSLLGAVGLGSKTESTGYVIYGDGISGNLPVTKIFDAIGPGGSVSGKTYLAQDGNYIRAVNTNVAYTKNDSSFYFTGKLSEIDNFVKLNSVSGTVGIKSAKYNIKKIDGSGILLAQ